MRLIFPVLPCVAAVIWKGSSGWARQHNGRRGRCRTVCGFSVCLTVHGGGVLLQDRAVKMHEGRRSRLAVRTLPSRRTDAICARAGRSTALTASCTATTRRGASTGEPLVPPCRAVTDTAWSLTKSQASSVCCRNWLAWYTSAHLLCRGMPFLVPSHAHLFIPAHRPCLAAGSPW